MIFECPILVWSENLFGKEQRTYSSIISPRCLRVGNAMPGIAADNRWDRQQRPLAGAAASAHSHDDNSDYVSSGYPITNQHRKQTKWSRMRTWSARLTEVWVLPTRHLATSGRRQPENSKNIAKCLTVISISISKHCLLAFSRLVFVCLNSIGRLPKSMLHHEWMYDSIRITTNRKERTNERTNYWLNHGFISFFNLFVRAFVRSLVSLFLSRFVFLLRCP